ncbi:hypothetical protein ADUPG1_009728 [Aduncisulcus paluster]|uniref:Uncharacterized protein n=1 Tax=Aduncisulcus paluster TaxID=2918883 RepID=A0ABQ5KXS2_9EUKA|nr:hypothetical protein ADUPG1_009728 [Aduncisulcus paluster]
MFRKTDYTKPEINVSQMALDAQRTKFCAEHSKVIDRSKRFRTHIELEREQFLSRKAQLVENRQKLKELLKREEKMFQEELKAKGLIATKAF